MDKIYISGGTFRTCPYEGRPEIVLFDNNGETFDRSKCPHHSKCTDDSCPLCTHLKN